MDKTFRAQLLASLITANCDAHVTGRKTRKAWDAEQNRLWKQAAEQCIAAEVMRLVCPSLGARS